MKNRSHQDDVVDRFIADNPDVKDLIYDIALMRQQFDFEPESPSPAMVEHWEREGKRQRQRRYADLLMPAAIGLAGYALGREVRETYMANPFKPHPGSSPVDCVRAKALDRLAGRIQLLDYLLPESSEPGEITIRDAVEELLAISRGDDPRHFAKIELGPDSRRRANAWRLAFHKAHALMWDAYFRAEGVPPKEVKLMVGAAFGEDPTTYARWKGPVEQEIPGTFKHLMRTVEGFRYRLADNPEDARAKLKRDGTLYKDEKWRQER